MIGHVFSGIMKEDRLKQLLGNYVFAPSVFFIVHDTIRYSVGKGVPSDLRDEGRAFSESGEIRWKKKANHEYLVSILSEHETGVPEELTKALLELEVKQGDIILVDPKEAKHVSPQFNSYPDNAKRLEVSYYTNKGITVLTRLRKLA